eukprot:365353-Chlamydomonas_euryale.AAC.22
MLHCLLCALEGADADRKAWMPRSRRACSATSTADRSKPSSASTAATARDKSPRRPWRGRFSAAPDGPADAAAPPPWLLMELRFAPARPTHVPAAPLDPAPLQPP